MAYYERVKPLDTFFNDITRKFGSGRDRYRDRDLGDYEDEEPMMRVLEFGEEVPLEEDLSEKDCVLPAVRCLSRTSRKTDARGPLPGQRAELSS
jgi:hypothetical protein